ncbi:MAG: CHAT domain-containing protein [Proteobacteria bacterium]|nr:CHAT domain-containing protein [Pseudomonadota bacterium]
MAIARGKRILPILLEFARCNRADDPYAFDFGAEEYLLRTEGGGFRTSTLKWTDDLLDDLETIRLPGCDPALVQRVGERLHRFVAPADFASLAQTISRAVEHGQPVHITVRSAAAELYALPWELLTLRASGQHIGELPGVLIRYAWPETRTAAAAEPRAEGGRILLAWSDAGGAVPAVQHLRALHNAAARGIFSFDPDRDALPDLSPGRLEAALNGAGEQNRPVSVLHILCHGVARGQSFGLAWNGDTGPGAVKSTCARRSTVQSGVADSRSQRSIMIDAGRLRQLLAQHADHLRLVVLCACDSGNMGQLGNHLGSIAQNLHTAGIQTVVASRFPLSVRGSMRFTRGFYTALLAGPRSVEQAFVAGRKRLLHDATTLDWASVQLYARPEDGDDNRPIVFRPYRGLLPFDASHSRFFFGRNAEQNEILADLQALIDAGKPRLLVVAGASGTGKSSVIMAGATPALTGACSGDDDRTLADDDNAGLDDRDQGDFAGPGRANTDSRADVDLVSRALARLADRPTNDLMEQGIELLRRGLAELDRSSNTGWEVAITRIGRAPMAALDRALAGRRNPSSRFLLVLDQFEELFTAVEDPAQRQALVRRLWSLCREQTSIHCIITIRVDFLGACGDIVVDDSGIRLDQVAYDEAHRVFVAQMGPDQLRAAIEEPAQLVGLELEPGLANAMLDDIGAEPGALPLLQYTLDLLWQRRTGRMLTADAYRELGGVTGALQKRADGLIESFDSEQKKQARRLLVRLVGIDDQVGLDTRRRATVAQLRPSDPSERAAFDRVLDILVDARLLVGGDENGSATLEVAHEALIRKWNTLRTWLQEDREKLAELHELEGWAEQWQTYGTLLKGEQLGYALRVRDKYPDDLDRSMTAMIDSSARRARRKRSHRRLLVEAIILVAVVMAVLSVLAVREAGQARRAHQDAEQAYREVEQRETELRASKAMLEQREQALTEANQELNRALHSAGEARHRAEDARQAAEKLARAAAAARDEAERARDAEQQAKERAARLSGQEKQRLQRDKETLERKISALEKELGGRALTKLPDWPPPSTGRSGKRSDQGASKQPGN